MPGIILNAALRSRIAQCHINAASYSNSRQQLIEIYEAARLALGKDKYFEEVCSALAKRAHELGVYKKGVK